MANRISFIGHLANHIGQTVTIFTTSGGESGSGFTGVLAAVYPTFVRLVTQIGSAPGCSLGNCCDPCLGHGHCHGGGRAEEATLGGAGRASCNPITLGSVVDIPIDRIASFVHNAVGSTY